MLRIDNLKRSFMAGTTKTVHKISDIKRVDRTQIKKEMGKKMVGIMSTGFLALTLLTNININNASAKYVLTEPPRYYSNLETDFMVTRIVPNEEKIEATETLMEGHDFHNIYHINFAFGSDPSDYELSQLGYTSKPGDTTIFLANATHGGAWNDGQSEDITRAFRQRGGTISGNTSGRMYFVATYSDMKVDFGRIDYSRCINSSVFISGEATECRAERLGNGKIQYQPYASDGTRVEIPEEEDIELTALTNRFIYESGDWPAEYEWIDDEPEPTTEPVVEPTPTAEPEPTVEPGNEDPEVTPATTLEESSKRLLESTSEAIPTITAAKSEIDDRTEVVSNSRNVATQAIDGESEKSVGVLGTEPITVEIQIVDGENSSESSAQNENNNMADELVANVAENRQDNVGVPELGKEFWNQKWVAVPVVLLAAAAALTGWWFLFFGKKKSKKEGKEEK